MEEYASGKAADAQSLVQQSAALDKLLAQVLAGLGGASSAGAADAAGALNSADTTDGGKQPAAGAAAAAATAAADPAEAGAAALAALATLRERLSEAASEAAAFAQLQQQGTEAERSKRTSAQVSGWCSKPTICDGLLAATASMRKALVHTACPCANAPQRCWLCTGAACWLELTMTSDPYCFCESAELIYTLITGAAGHRQPGVGSQAATQRGQQHGL